MLYFSFVPIGPLVVQLDSFWKKIRSTFFFYLVKSSWTPSFLEEEQSVCLSDSYHWALEIYAQCASNITLPSNALIHLLVLKISSAQSPARTSECSIENSRTALAAERHIVVSVQGINHQSTKKRWVISLSYMFICGQVNQQTIRTPLKNSHGFELTCLIRCQNTRIVSNHYRPLKYNLPRVSHKRETSSRQGEPITYCNRKCFLLRTSYKLYLCQ